MNTLSDLRKELFADGSLSKEEVARLHDALYDEEGMTRAKGDFLFELKDTVNKERIHDDFRVLFIDAISALLLEDETSPGEIDETEAKWLRARIQSKGYFDSIDDELLDNLRAKSINFPEILNHKNKIVRKFEAGLYFSRYLTIMAVIGAALSALALFVKGTFVVALGVKEFFSSFSVESAHDYEGLIEVFVSSVDIYLFAMVLVIFSMGVYELFISKIDPVEQKADRRPSWLQIKNIDDLKSSLGKVILMVLIVSFFKHALIVEYKTAIDLLFLAIGVVLIALALYLAHSQHKHNERKEE
jgi:uncharacterized membrane protein YqhA